MQWPSIANMVQIFVEGCDKVTRFDIPEDLDNENNTCNNLVLEISKSFHIPTDVFYITTKGGKQIKSTDDITSYDCCTLLLKLRLCGGIDFQHREGSKIGGGGTTNILILLGQQLQFASIILLKIFS